ncbi:bactericidal permeability-increasing protein [Pempheris klunzingeri]|uniref:bactericidal permeability-increasing protein n=1 Tax=Pempheris klunzingeri TaxID=3127111 RepID=UPI00397F5837
MLPSGIVVLLLFLVADTCGENPAIQLILNNKGLQYGKHVGAGWIQDKLELVTLPDISGDTMFGTLHYTLTGINITKCDFPEPSVQFYQDATGFKTSVSGFNIAVTGGWMARLGLIHDRGSFDMAIFKVDVTSVMGLGEDPDRHLSVTDVSCEAHVGDVDVQFHGGASWIFKIFVNHIKGRIRGVIEDKICPYVEESIGNLEHHLQAVNVSFDVNQDVTLDLPLTGSPVVNVSCLNLGLKGQFYSIKNHSDPPFKAQPFTVPEQPGYMLSMGLSEFTLNSALYGYYSAGLFQALINDSMIPPSLPVHLNTSSMGPFVPQLPKMFPDLLMNLQVYATEVPLFSLQPGAVGLSVQGTVKASAIQKNATETPLFQLNVDSKFSGKVWIAAGRLKGSMAMNNLSVTLQGSEVGPVKTEAIEQFMKIGATAVMIKVNEKLGDGVALPRMKQAQLVNTVLQVEEGFIAMSSDAQVFLADIFN